MKAGALFEITPLTIADYEEVLALWRACPGIGLSAADEKPAIAAYLERNPGMSFCARAAGRLIGTVLGGHDGRRGYLHHLAVHPEHRKQGAGSALVDRCMETLRGEGIDKCHLFIFEDNLSGIAFWTHIGWSKRSDIGIMSRDL